MERERLDDQEAFTHLRRAARSSGRKLTELAREVAAGQPLPGYGPGRRGPGRSRLMARRTPLSQNLRPGTAYHRVARELLALASDSLSDAVASVLASKVAPAQAG
jgi:hypothetical protein